MFLTIKIITEGVWYYNLVSFYKQNVFYCFLIKMFDQNLNSQNNK